MICQYYANSKLFKFSETRTRFACVLSDTSANYPTLNLADLLTDWWINSGIEILQHTLAVWSQSSEQVGNA